MLSNLGYKKNLFILPFDHKSSFYELFGFTNPEPSNEEKEIIIEAKKIIYEAFKKALKQEIPKDQAAILIDEEYGDEIIRDAINNNLNVVLATEKSGQKEFFFEYGDDYAKHIEKYRPAFVKALIHYNPNNDPLFKMRQQQKMTILNNYCHDKGYKFLLEILIDPTNLQLSEANGNNTLYDGDTRPNLTAKTIEELQASGIEPDIWKIEGMEDQDSYEIVSLQARTGDRSNVGMVILGRAENQERVEKWIKSGNKIKGIIGFAIGRTVFWGPLTDYKNGKIEKEKTIELIANNYLRFYHIFINKD